MATFSIDQVANSQTNMKQDQIKRSVNTVVTPTVTPVTNRQGTRSGAHS